MERGRPARKNKCGQDARAPQRKRPERRPRIRERGCPARKSRSAGVPPAKTNAGKMPALHRGSGLNAVRESGSAGVPPAIHDHSEKPRERGLRFPTGPKPRPGVKRRAEDRLRRTRPVNGPSRWDKTRSAGVSPAKTNAGKMPALHRGSGLNAVRESGSAGVSPARPGARASRPQFTNAPRSPVNGACGSPPPRHRAPASNAGPKTACGGQGPSTGLWIGRFPNAANARRPVGRH